MWRVMGIGVVLNGLIRLLSAMATLRKESSFVSFKTRISLFNSLSIAAFFPPESERAERPFFDCRGLPN